MIAYRDFVPARVPGGFLRSDRYTSLDEAVGELNAWLRANPVELVAVETVVLPNIFDDRQEGTRDAHLETVEASTSTNSWHQFVRLWYRS